MKTAFSLLAAASLALSSATFAAGVKDYQVTGPIAELNDTMIVIEKGAKKERFEIARDANTKVERRDEGWRQGHGSLHDDGHRRRSESRQGKKERRR